MVYPSVQQREITASASVAQDAELLLSTTEENEGFKSLTAGRVDSVISKVTKKLDGKVVFVLTFNGLDDEDMAAADLGSRTELSMKGQVIFDKLMGYLPKLEAVGELIKCVESKEIDGRRQIVLFSSFLTSKHESQNT